MSRNLKRSRRRGSCQIPPLITVTAGHRGQATTEEPCAGVIGRVAALLSLPRVVIHISLITVSISIMISYHKTCLTPCIRLISSPSSRSYHALPLLEQWHESGVSVLGGMSKRPARLVKAFSKSPNWCDCSPALIPFVKGTIVSPVNKCLRA